MRNTKAGNVNALEQLQTTNGLCMSNWKPAATLIWVVLCALPSATSAAEQKARPRSTTAIEADYAKKLSLPTSCGNRQYLASIANDYRTACDQIARELQATIRAAGGECDHITLVAPAIHATTVSDAVCVVRGGDVVFGLTTNTVRYLVYPSRIERLPADNEEARAAIDASLAKAMAAWRADGEKAAAVRQEERQKDIEARRWSAVASDLSIRRKRCDKLLAVEKTSGGGEFTATCEVRGKEKKYKLYFSGVE